MGLKGVANVDDVGLGLRGEVIVDIAELGLRVVAVMAKAGLEFEDEVIVDIAGLV